MEAHKPTPIEIPPPRDEATLLAFYLEGVPLVQIARALQVGVPTVLDFLRTPEVRACIEQYEESIERQTRLFAIASRIPAMATLREVCASEGSLAERRRAGSDLLRQSRAAERSAKGQRFTRTAHSTPNPDKFIPDPNVEPTPDIPLHVRPLEPYELNLDLNAEAPVVSKPSPSIANESPKNHINGQAAPSASNPDHAHDHRAQGSFTAREHTASWHAFDRAEPGPSAPNLNADPIAESPATTTQDLPQSSQPIEPPLLVRQTPTRIASPYDSICAPEISTPLPDAVPVAA